MKRNNKISKIIISLCTIYYLWMFLRIIILKNGFNNYNHNFNLELFDFINYIGLNKTFFVNFLGNIFIFVPLSIILKYHFNFLTSYNIIFIGFITSLSFELIQLATGWGIFDLDDILLNTLGTILGIVIYHYLNKKNITSQFLISFGTLGLLITYNYYPYLITSFI